MQRIPENAGNRMLSGEVWVDHTYINAPMSVRKGKKRRGLSRHLLQVAAGIDSCGHVLLRLGSWELAGTGDSEDAFLGHIASGSCVYHDMGHFGGCFPGCKETAVNSKDGEPTEFSIRSTGCVPRSSACLPCTCGSTERTFPYG